MRSTPCMCVHGGEKVCKKNHRLRSDQKCKNAQNKNAMPKLFLCFLPKETITLTDEEGIDVL